MVIAIKCIFCSRVKTEAGLLVSGVEGNICAHCIEQAYKMIHSFKKKSMEYLLEQLIQKSLSILLIGM